MVLILCIVAGFIIIPAVSAEKEYRINSGKESNFVSGEKNYIISPWTQSSLDKGNFIPSLKSTQYIKKGQTVIQNVKVGSRVKYLEVDLNWGDKSDSLSLCVYTPSGSKLGTYRDSSDRRVEGRIHLKIDPASGYVGKGTWKFKVYGESVRGTESYTFNISQH